MIERLESIFGDERNYNVAEQDGGPAEFPDGGQWFFCHDWSYYVARCLPGRTQLFGFACASNPGTAFDDNFDGHNFAVVDERYIVDGWVKNVEGFSSRAVFDLWNEADEAIVAKIYGDPARWERCSYMEQVLRLRTFEQMEKDFEGTDFGEFHPSGLELASRRTMAFSA